MNLNANTTISDLIEHALTRPAPATNIPIERDGIIIGGIILIVGERYFENVKGLLPRHQPGQGSPTAP